MNYKKLFFQTIPTVGAIGLSACAPNRDPDGGGDGGDVSGLVGAWELRSFGYAEGYYYTYPQVTSEGEDCTYSQGIFLQVEEGFSAEMILATQTEGCDAYTKSYGYSYPGTGEELESGLVRLAFNGFLSMDCPTAPTSAMQCSQVFDDSKPYYYEKPYYDGRRGGYYDQVFNWERTTVSAIPEVDVDVGVPAPGDAPTEDVVDED